MNPLYPFPGGFPLYFSDPTQNFSAYPALLLNTTETGDKLLDRLDSDTKDYVLKHTSTDRSASEVINCINDLNSK